MSSTEHDRSMLGAYALGVLDPDEARRVYAHLASCAACRREVDEFLALRGALDDVPPEAFLDGPPDGGDLLLQRTMRRVRSGEPDETPGQRRGRPRIAAVAAVVVLAASALGGGVLLGRQTAPNDVAAPPPSTTTTTPADARTATVTDPDTGVTMAVTLTPKAGWVWVSATVSGVPAGEHCELRVVPRTGEPVLAGGWLVSDKGEQEGTPLEGTALVDPADVQAVTVVTTDNRTMVSAQL